MERLCCCTFMHPKRAVQIQYFCSEPSSCYSRANWVSGVAICSNFFKSIWHSLPRCFSCWAQRVSSRGSWTEISMWPQCWLADPNHCWKATAWCLPEDSTNKVVVSSCPAFTIMGWHQIIAVKRDWCAYPARSHLFRHSLINLRFLEWMVG